MTRGRWLAISVAFASIVALAIALRGCNDEPSQRSAQPASSELPAANVDAARRTRQRAPDSGDATEADPDPVPDSAAPERVDPDDARPLRTFTVFSIETRRPMSGVALATGSGQERKSLGVTDADGTIAVPTGSERRVSVEDDEYTIAFRRVTTSRGERADPRGLELWIARTIAVSGRVSIQGEVEDADPTSVTLALAFRPDLAHAIGVEPVSLLDDRIKSVATGRSSSSSASTATSGS